MSTVRTNGNADASFVISFFKRRTDNQPHQEFLTWAELVQRLKQPAVRTAKDGPLFSPATFKGTRAKANVESVSMLVLDFDHGVDDDAQRILEPWRRRSLSAAAYTTHSHLRKIPKSNATAEPRWRVVIPLLEPIPAREYPSLFALG